MVFNILDLDGVEGADADLQGEVVKMGPAIFQFGDQFGREVQSRGRCGHGDAFVEVRIDGLVTLVVIIALVS